MRSVPGGVICEDDAGAREALRAILRRRGFTILAEVDRPHELLTTVAGAHADVVLLELALAGVAGLRIIPVILAAAPEAEIIVLSPFPNLRPAAIEAGAYDLVGTDDLRDLHHALTRLLARAEPPMEILPASEVVVAPVVAKAVDGNGASGHRKN